MKKTQKLVNFIKVTRGMGRKNMKLTYTTNLIKKGRKMVWQVVESGNSIIKSFFFEEDGQSLCDFQNKHKSMVSKWWYTDRFYVLKTLGK